MQHAALFLFFVMAAECAAQQIPWCVAHSNPGVMRFGPLPSDLHYSPSNYQQLQNRSPLPKYHLQGLLDRYVVQYAEYVDDYGATSSYITLFIKNTDVYSVLDYLQVNPYTWRDFEKAIIDADHQPDRDLITRIKLMESDCDCVMRVYDLKASDIPSTATSLPCSTVQQMNNPYHLTKVETRFVTPKMFFIINEHTKYPGCRQGTTTGVRDEFGALHPHLSEPSYFSKAMSTGVTSMALTGNLWKYKMDYLEYHEQGGAAYSYVALSYDTSGMYYLQAPIGPQYKVIEYLRVEPTNWRIIQEAILEGSHSASSNWKLRVKYLTDACNCVMRVYDLRQTDIPGTAETRACNGRTRPGRPHRLEGALHQSATPTAGLTRSPGSSVKYPGCDPSNNDGVVNEFGALPRDLTLGGHYRQNIYTSIANTKFQLEGALSHFRVEYKEYEDKFGVGTGVFAFLILNYDDGVKDTVLDYIRVNHLRWQEIENAIVSVDNVPDGKIRLQFLISDCSCVTREYNMKIAELDFRGKTVPCPASLNPLPLRRTTQLTSRQF